MKRNSILNGIILSFLLIIGQHVQAQTSLTGNQTYTQTVATGFDAATASIDVSNTAGLAILDEILVIQMKGAVIDLTNTVNFGHVNNYNGAGAFELATICAIDGNTITLDKFLINTYDPAGIVQVIKVPVYANVSVDGPLTAPAWNGTSGGVLLMKADQITLNNDIDMSGKGFRGGQFQNSNLNCNFLTVRADYFYTSADDAGEKGEGIAASNPAYRFGKGALASGGGGGNDHNAGGAGGSNISGGGIGGNNGETGFFNCKGVHGGVGGLLQGSTNRIFLGGGGGAGHGNNNLGEDGADGGGIVILMSNVIIGNGNTINVDGSDALQTQGGDGGGGGGAGGSVYIQCKTFNTAITVNAEGGKGSNVYDASAPRCWGPGGGGAGGHIKLSATLPGVMTINKNGGTPGTNVHSQSSCTGSNSGATSGFLGVQAINAGLIPQGTTDYTGCSVTLPVELISFATTKIEKTVKAEWITAEEVNTDYFVLERSKNGFDFEEVQTIIAKGEGSGRFYYEYLDENPWAGGSYYRLKQVDLNGDFVNSELRMVTINEDITIHAVYPNPVKSNVTVTMEVGAVEDAEVVVYLFDMFGRLAMEQPVSLGEGFNTISLKTLNLVPGSYMLRMQNGETSIVEKLTIY